MKILGLAVSLLLFPQIAMAQEEVANSTSATESSDIASPAAELPTEEATSPAELIATPAATPTTTSSMPTSPLRDFFSSETNRAGILFIAIIVLLLVAFVAGKKSSEYNHQDEVE